MGKNIDIIRWLESFVNKILAYKEYLNGLDTAIGDGDHGDNMEKGVLELNSYIQIHLESLEKNRNNPQELLNIMSIIFLSNISGASGPLYSTAFKNMSDCWKDEDTSLTDIILCGCEGIKRIGSCELGDKTMYDVWYGVYLLLKEGSLTTKNIQQQVLETKDKLAKKGRASYFGERSVGHIDPGAQSSGYFFEAMLESIEDK